MTSLNVTVCRYPRRQQGFEYPNCPSHWRMHLFCSRLDIHQRRWYIAHIPHPFFWVYDGFRRMLSR
jgi:hypothetical protein